MGQAKALRLDQCGVKRAIMDCSVLHGKKPIGRGVFSAVFPGTRKNTVLKLTVDDISYYMLNDGCCRVKHRHFPRVIENHGMVGDTRIHGHNYGLYLFEIERLEKLAPGSEAKRLARLIGDVQSRTSRLTTWKLPEQEQAMVALESMANDSSLPRSVRNALTELKDFCSYVGGSLDMHMANFMQRKNGELVMTDPLANPTIIRAARAQLSRRGW